MRHHLQAFRQRNAALQPAREGTARGTLWAAFIGLEFYLLSNPIAFQPDFRILLTMAVQTALLLALLDLRRLRYPRVPIVLLAFAGFAVASWWWTVEKSLTEGGLWLYGSVAALALLIGANVTTRVLVAGMTLGGLLVLGASLYAWYQQIPNAIIPPETLYDGYLAGVGTNRNILSYTMVLSLGFLAGALPARWWARLTWLVCVAALMVGVFLAQSATGFVAGTVVVVLGLGLAAVERLSRRVRVGTGLVVALAIVGGVWWVNQNQLALGTAMSRDSLTLSGRVPLWEAIIDQTASHRAEGFGWGTVWLHPWLPAPDNPVAQSIYDGAGVFMSHGHNSFLDVLPQLGVIGVVLLALLHVAPLVTAMVARTGTRRDLDTLLTSRVVVSSMAAVLLFGLTEPITSTPLGWFCLCLIVTVAAASVSGTPFRRTRPRSGRHSGRHAARVASTP